MAHCYLMADRQTDSGPLKISPAMQTFESTEYEVEMLFVETDAIVFHYDLIHPIHLRLSGQAPPPIHNAFA